MKMEQTQCSETLVYKIQMSGNHPKERIQHSEHGKSLKSRIILSRRYSLNWSRNFWTEVSLLWEKTAFIPPHVKVESSLDSHAQLLQDILVLSSHNKKKTCLTDFMVQGLSSLTGSYSNCQ